MVLELSPVSFDYAHQQEYFQPKCEENQMGNLDLMEKLIHL